MSNAAARIRESLTENLALWSDYDEALRAETRPAWRVKLSQRKTAIQGVIDRQLALLKEADGETNG